MKPARVHVALAGSLALAMAAFAQTESAAPATSETPAASVTSYTIAPAPDPLASAAGVYATYQSDVTDIEQGEFSSVDDIQDALSDLGGQNAEQLARGWIAYSALVAAQDPEFRAAVRDIEGFYGQDYLIRGLQNDVRYARTLNGGNTAVRAALNAGDADAMRLKNTGEFVKEQSYSLQAYGWAKGTLGDSGALATRLRSDSLIGRAARSNLTTAFRAPDIEPVLSVAGRTGAPSVWKNVSSTAQSIRPIKVSDVIGRVTPLRIAPGKEQVADKIATLAAYRILGSEGASVAPVQSAMTERETQGCINMAQLNLQQCIAATHQHFEVPFCLGEHALTEIGSCIAKVSN